MSIILSLSSRKKASTLLPGKTNIHTHTKKKKKSIMQRKKREDDSFWRSSQQEEKTKKKKANKLQGKVRILRRQTACLRKTSTGNKQTKSTVLLIREPEQLF